MMCQYQNKMDMVNFVGTKEKMMSCKPCLKYKFSYKIHGRKLLLADLSLLQLLSTKLFGKPFTFAPAVVIYIIRVIMVATLLKG